MSLGHLSFFFLIIIFFFYILGHVFTLIQIQMMEVSLFAAGNLWARVVVPDIPIVPDPTLDIT